MNVVEFTGLVFVGTLTAGFLGALTGMGGGIVIVPLLTLRFWDRHPLCHRGLPDVGDRDFVRGRRGVCQRRLF